MVQPRSLGPQSGTEPATNTASRGDSTEVFRTAIRLRNSHNPYSRSPGSAGVYRTVPARDPTTKPAGLRESNGTSRPGTTNGFAADHGSQRFPAGPNGPILPGNAPTVFQPTMVPRSAHGSPGEASSYGSQPVTVSCGFPAGPSGPIPPGKAPTVFQPTRVPRSVHGPPRESSTRPATVHSRSRFHRFFSQVPTRSAGFGTRIHRPA